MGHNVVHHGYTNLKDFDFVWQPYSLQAYEALPAWKKGLEKVYRSAWAPWLYYGVEIWWKRMYFPSKADLIAAVAEGLQLEIRHAIFSVMDDNQPILEMMQAIIWAIYKVSQQHRDLMHVIEMDVLLGGSKRLQLEQDQQVGQMMLMLETARERQEIDSSLDLQITAELVSGVMMPLSRAIIFGQSDIAPERYIKETVSFLRRALGITSEASII